MGRGVGYPFSFPGADCGILRTPRCGGVGNLRGIEELVRLGRGEDLKQQALGYAGDEAADVLEA